MYFVYDNCVTELFVSKTSIETTCSILNTFTFIGCLHWCMLRCSINHNLIIDLIMGFPTMVSRVPDIYWLPSPLLSLRKQYLLFSVSEYDAVSSSQCNLLIIHFDLNPWSSWAEWVGCKECLHPYTGREMSVNL